MMEENAPIQEQQNQETHQEPQREIQTWGSGPSLVPSLPTLSPPKLPMGTIIEKVTLPATVPATIHTPKAIYQIEITKDKKNQVAKPESEDIKIEQNNDGSIKVERTICDGEVKLGPFQSCLKEFTGVTAFGWVTAVAGLIVLWKWLDWKFKNK